jgi:hypothetical protein
MPCLPCHLPLSAAQVLLPYLRAKLDRAYVRLSSQQQRDEGGGHGLLGLALGRAAVAGSTGQQQQQQARTQATATLTCPPACVCV